ncbi:MAG: hypothetical protein ACLT98_16120 [Eggerthellaceae bacterium]
MPAVYCRRWVKKARYDRHGTQGRALAWSARRNVGEDGLRRLSEARVAIFGLGVVKLRRALARGRGTLLLVDRCGGESNINRP